MAEDPKPLRSSLNAVFASIKAYLAEETGLAAEFVRIIARRQRPPKLIAGQDILLRDRGFTVDGGNSDRHDCRIWRKLGVVIRTRYELDQAGSDEIWMTDLVEGNVVAEEEVMDALINHQPADEDDNHLLFEPMKLLGGETRDREADGWGEVELHFSMAIELPLDQSWQ
jgi:hypothetical protein